MQQFFLLGIVQGVTEFLPVSSSGHLYIVDALLHITQHSLAYFVWLHFATLCAVVIFFWKDIVALCKDKKMLKNIIVATACTVSGAVIIEYAAGSFFEKGAVIGAAYIVTAFLLFSTRGCKPSRKINELTTTDAVIFGVTQSMAVFPGLSRSGITIVTLMRRGLRPLDAFRFSFLAGIPVIAAAFIKELPPLLSSGIHSSLLGIGFISAFLSGLAALFILRGILKRNFLYYFGYYCIIASVVSILL